ncbi:MAG: thermonuclease family protein [Hyphomonadaceae bacterium]
MLIPRVVVALAVLGLGACEPTAPITQPSIEASSDVRTLISGVATVHDGDTIKFDGMRVRIWGVDAPEGLQACGENMPGDAATEALRQLAEGRRVDCVMVDYDGKNRRPNAICTASNIDLGQRMVEQGWAWDYPEYSKGKYGEAQRTAEAAGIGVHRLGCELPWVWRQNDKAGGGQ